MFFFFFLIGCLKRIFYVKKMLMSFDISSTVRKCKQSYVKYTIKGIFLIRRREAAGIVLSAA